MKNPVNILLVDDQPAKLLSYETILAGLGENLIQAKSGSEALEILLKNEIAVILVDVCMPDLSGFELASMIRKHPRFQQTAIILISGVFVEDDDRLRGYGFGAVDYVSVPIIPGILQAKVSVFAELYRKTHELEQLNRDLEQRVAERTTEIEASSARLGRSEERLRLVLSAAGIQGWTLDLTTGEITFVASASYSGPGSLSLSEFLANVHHDDQPGFQRALDLAARGERDFHIEFRSGQGAEEQCWLARGVVLRDAAGQPQAIGGMNINITSRRRAEEERARLLKNADDARWEAEMANRLKDQFLAALSHELRTPLNAITGWSDLLNKGALDPETQSKAIDTIHRNALLEATLISDLLDVSRIISGKLQLELKAADLAAVVQASLDSVRPEAEAKHIHVEAGLAAGLKPLAGDASRLQQVVSNLLSNAVKFTPDDGHIWVRLKQAGDNLELTVEDDGPGIPPEFLPYVFDRFRQGDSSTTRAHQGLGLGLAIVRSLVEMHGGSVRATNRKNGSGAIFTVTLPISESLVNAVSSANKAAQPFSIASGGLSPVNLTGARVLVVDDKADGREIAAVILERAGAEVRSTGSAAEAFEQFTREKFHAIVADIEMPGEDGYSLIQKLRSLPSAQGGQVRAVALTAHASASDRMRILESGFDLHLPKPVIPRDLIAAVATPKKRAKTNPAALSQKTT